MGGACAVRPDEKLATWKCGRRDRRLYIVPATYWDPNKWLAIIAGAADHNNAWKLGEKPPITDDPLRAGFQVIPLYQY